MVVLGTSSLFIVAGLAIVIGFVANYLFRRFKAPDVLIIMLFGYLIGPTAFGLIEADVTDLVESLVPYVSALALAFIMFNGGLELDLHEVRHSARTTLLLAAGGFGMVLISISLMLYFLLDIPLQYAILGGVVFCSTSAPTVIPMIVNMECSRRIKTVLTLESAITDTLVVGIGTALVVYFSQDSASLAGTTIGLISSLAVAFLVGLLASLIWARLLPFLQGFKYYYLLTLGVLLLLYALCEIITPYGGGVIVVLVFGLMLNNAHYVHGLLPRSLRQPLLNNEFKVINEEAAFFIKVFFFTFLGLYVSTIDFQVTYLVLGLMVFIALLLIRVAMTRLVSKNAKMDNAERTMLYTMFPRGLCTVVTALLPLSYGLDIGEAQQALIGIVSTVVVLTTLLASFGAYMAERKLCQMKKIEEMEEFLIPEF
ncbi:MAG: cation:proton antiporter [Methanomassiliicoccales archaeon]|nr:cation:proton antiporter [Methanomassiliicoccales archaeon]